MINRVFSTTVQRFSSASNSKLLDLLKTMPKEQKHIAEAQKQRKKIKEKFSKYSPGKVTLQVLGTGAKGAPRSLYIFSDQSRYLFNCGEGTQRLAHEHKMKLAKLEHVFITQPSWKNIGGLPGAALTIQDVGVPQIILHGPRGLEEIFVATHRFVVIKDLQIRMAQCDESTEFEDNVMKVRYVPLIRSKVIKQNINRTNVDQVDDDDVDYYAHEHSGKRQIQQQISESSKLALQQVKEKGISMTYICQLQPRPGALCLDKCVKAGVPPGPLLGKLKAGEDVVLANGVTVKASDVCDPDDPGPVFIVVECPSEDYLDSLLNNEQFKQHQNLTSKEEDLAYLVVHFSPENVVNHPRYQEWMERFSISCQHLMLNESNTCMGSLSVHRIQYKLNLLSNRIFPLLLDEGTEKLIDPPNKKLKSDSSLSIEKLSVQSPPINIEPFQKIINPKTLYSHHLRPRKGFDSSAELKLFPSEFIDETMAIEDFSNTLKELKANLDDCKTDSVNTYPRLLFLGTGSSIPNKTRNTSGMLLDISEDCSIIMDCGEGTYGQIVRFFGQNYSDEVLIKIKAVYISHLHADHHLGLIGLLQGRRQAFINLQHEPKPLYLVAPRQILWWLNFYNNCFEDINSEFELIQNGQLMLDGHQLEVTKEEQILNDLHLSEINTCYVKHCPNAFGVSFTDKLGCKITYSGDTMPCQNLVKLGIDSDLLIHEATMEDELADEAVIKMHSTTSQAIEIGKLMNAKYTLLTHFSQRYAKLPRINENFSDNIGIAFDNMQVSLNELKILHHFYPALKLMFGEHYEEMEVKTAKRLMRIERQKEAIMDKNK